MNVCTNILTHYTYTNTHYLYLHKLHIQPAFTVADNQRCLKSKSMLHTTVEDTAIAMQRLTKAQLHSQFLRQEIPLMEVIYRCKYSKFMNIHNVYVDLCINI